MKTEELKAIELSDTQITKVFELRSKEIEANKVLVATLKAEKSAAEAAKIAAETMVETIKKDYVSPEDLKIVKSEKKALQTQIDTLVKDHESKINEINYTNALDESLKGYGVEDLDYIKFKLNKDNIKFEDGKLEGLDKEIEALKANHPKHFADSSQQGAPLFTTKSSSDNGGRLTKDSTMAIKDSSSRIKAIQENPGLFK